MAIIPINLKAGTLETTEQEMIVGIDLGTTNSLVAYIKDGEAVCVSDPEGRNTLVPSVVHFGPDQRIMVGTAAKDFLVTDPANTIYSVKRLMGKSYTDVQNAEGHLGYRILNEDKDALVKVRVGERFYTPIELSALILQELRQRVESATQSTINKAVITVPAYFNDNQRQATRDAGRLAGLDVLRIINEPTAAALAYGIGQNRERGKEIVAVYDLGGGTFDVSVLQIEDGIYEVLATHGDTWLGGDDFDKLIVQDFLNQLNIDEKILEKEKSLSQELRMVAEEAKKSLSTQAHFEGYVQGQIVHLSKTAFEMLIGPLVARTLSSCTSALRDANLQAAQIDKVVMVGGSTRVPLVKEQVAAFFGRPVYDQLNPDEVVALGAAIQADVLAGNQQDVLLLDITPLSLGIETVGGLMDVIIPRNTKVPGKAGRQYTTSVDGQVKLQISVYQGERDLVEHNRKLGAFVLSGIPPMPAGIPKIDIQFILNADGILTVRARELRSNLEQQIEIRPTYGITEEEMGMMLLDSIQHAQSDMQVRGLLEARNEANNILLSGRKFLKQNEAILEADEVAESTRLLDLLEQNTQGTDKDAIHAAMDALNAYTTPLAHRAMDVNIREAMKGQRIG